MNATPFHPSPSEDRPPEHPSHFHNPWDTSDPDNPHFTHREWRPTPNTRITRTTFQTDSPGAIPNLFSMMNEGHIYGTAAHPGASPFPSPGFGGRAGHPHHHHHHHLHRPWGPSGESTMPHLGPPAFHASASPGATGAHTASANVIGMPFDLNNLFQTLFAQPHPGHEATHPGQGGASPNFANLLSSIFNPAAFQEGQHGDAVYSEEAMDRLLTQLMEQNNVSHAPGPAPAAAIAALPKVLVEEKMMGNDGKAECSVCMENVQIRDEVTMLPCKHWFHGECVGAWLKEHNTCPHCRQGIASTPATPSTGPQPQHQAMPGSFPAAQQPQVGLHIPTGPPGPSFANPISVPSSPRSPSSPHPASPAGYPTRTTHTRSLGRSASITSGRNGNGGFHFSIQAGVPPSFTRPSPSRRRDFSFSSSRSHSDEQRHHSRSHSNSGSSHHSRHSGRRGDGRSSASNNSRDNTGGGGITGWMRQRFGGS